MDISIIFWGIIYFYLILHKVYVNEQVYSYQLIWIKTRMTTSISSETFEEEKIES